MKFGIWGLMACSALMGQTVLMDNLFHDESTWTLPDCAQFIELDGQRTLKVELPADQYRGMAAAVLPFDYSAKGLAGKVLRMSGEMKFENVTKPKDPWNGTKFMLTIPRENAETRYCHPAGQYGSSDWLPMNAQVTLTEDMKPGSIVLGLQDATGTVWFRKVKLELNDQTAIFPSLSGENFQAPYTDRVRKEPPRRGVMSTGRYHDGIVERHMPDLKAWGANLLRWQITRNWNTKRDNQDRFEYLSWVASNIPGTLKILDKAQELGMKVVVDLHVAPGGRDEGGFMLMFDDPAFAEAFKDVWRMLASACKGHPAIYGYDLINEPNQPAGVVARDYLSLQFDVAKIVREIDPDTPIIIESNGWDAASTYTYMSALPLKDIIYQAHCYEPFPFTHQGVYGKPTGIVYPNPEKGWDKEFIRKYLQPVRDFQLKHGARIYIGEFSAIRWAKGADAYLRDCISLFEEYGWDWSYHAFREWSGWSVEHSDDMDDENPATTETSRKKALLDGFRLNVDKE